MSALSSRVRVLSIFKQLHKTRKVVFKEDDYALSAARIKINDEFKKNKAETEAGKVDELIKKAQDVDKVLKELVVQAEHITKDKVRLNIREETHKIPNKMFDPDAPLPPPRRRKKKTSENSET